MSPPAESATELPAVSSAVRFPFATLRDGQALLVRDIDSAIGAGLTLLCSAPTGIGKTAAALYPMLARATAEKRRVFFVTSRNSQQELALETAREMIREDSGVVAVQIRARERICPRDGRRCREERCRYQESFGARLERSGLLESLAQERVVDGDTVQARALERRLCPFEVSLSLAERSQLVIGDLNYVFDPRVYLRRFFDTEYERELLIVDEAHDLPDRIAKAYSPALSPERLAALSGLCLAQSESVFLGAGLALGELGAGLDETYARLCQERDGPGPHLEPPPPDLLERVGALTDEALGRYTAWKADGGKLPAVFDARFPREAGVGDVLLETLYTAREFCGVAELGSDRFATLFSRERVQTLCLDPAPFLRERAQGFRSVVYMSATLTPLPFFTERLGAGGPACETLELASPFPRENRLLVAATGVDTRFRQRAEEAPRIAETIAAAAALRRGNYLAFFSSFAFRDQVVAKLPRALAGGRLRVLLQLPGQPVEPLLAQLKKPPDETRLLCGVLGGVLAQGVDYPGDMAIGVFVVGPGLPAVSPEQELVKSYYEREMGLGFEFAYRLPGLNRVVQAGGRAIRTPTDRAFVLLLGRRFGEPAYRDRLPAAWREELVTTDDPLPLVRAFWERAIASDAAANRLG